jgi:hypothetical protein
VLGLPVGHRTVSRVRHYWHPETGGHRAKPDLEPCPHARMHADESVISGNGKVATGGTDSVRLYGEPLSLFGRFALDWVSIMIGYNLLVSLAHLAIGTPSTSPRVVPSFSTEQNK